LSTLESKYAQCDQVFCDDCKMSHLRSKISKRHIFLSGPNINMEKKAGCADHDENFIYLCETSFISCLCHFVFVRVYGICNRMCSVSQHKRLIIVPIK
jgi:hypothetical protein